MFVNSSFQIIGDSITFLSGDLTEKIKANTKKIVSRIAITTFLSEILFIKVTSELNFSQELFFRKFPKNIS